MAKTGTHIRYSTGVIAYPVFFVMLIWLVFWFQVRVFPPIKTLGIIPRSIDGIPGIVLSPLIHADILHLYHNTLPLLFLSAALFYFYRKIAWKVVLYGIIISGLFTWFIGRPSIHIGASGLIYVLASFIFFKGIFTKYYRLVALSLIIVFLYGSMVWYIFPVKDGISWEGHLGGALAGLLFALYFRKSLPIPERYAWQEPTYNEENDPFLKHFDENGNFVGSKELQEREEKANNSNDIEINYIYKPNKD
ncbi:rhomboid family intramembrane serine protease [Aegicerativicinus sediminis]|uniref:rhomboid family intramembrane serine protease n=1 Tax=Aegicerativicinus sediminis TaxID=2893202 RepID=UPI001E460A5D|nr:rhomboid family intramembrane serine protease [Aegicerativicinus sediminis]